MSLRVSAPRAFCLSSVFKNRLLVTVTTDTSGVTGLCDNIVLAGLTGLCGPPRCHLEWRFGKYLAASTEQCTNTHAENLCRAVLCCAVLYYLCCVVLLCCAVLCYVARVLCCVGLGCVVLGCAVI